jgi:hypothetical protein
LYEAIVLKKICNRMKKYSQPSQIFHYATNVCVNTMFNIQLVNSELTRHFKKMEYHLSTDVLPDALLAYSSKSQWNISVIYYRKISSHFPTKCYKLHSKSKGLTGNELLFFKRSSSSKSTNVTIFVTKVTKQSLLRWLQCLDWISEW